jgi:hypothetical protein
MRGEEYDYLLEDGEPPHEGDYDERWDRWKVLEVVGESDRAYCVHVRTAGGAEYDNVWLPKSRCEFSFAEAPRPRQPVGVVRVPGWIADSKTVTHASDVKKRSAGVYNLTPDLVDPDDGWRPF